MAMFREHIAGGAVVAAAVATTVYFYALITDPPMLVVLFVVTTIASFLPDLDSDSSLPFYLLFGTFTIFCGGIALYYTLTFETYTWQILLGVPLGVMLFVWGVVGWVFKCLTTHRGMFHSVPAALIAGVAAMLVLRHLEHTELVALVFAVGMVAGYVTHLILDELYAFVNMEGLPFLPKKSVGSALKFVSSSRLLTIFTYTILAGLVYLVTQDMSLTLFLESIVASVT